MCGWYRRVINCQSATPRNQLVEYGSQHNARQVEKIVYVHEITPEFLTDWMGNLERQNVLLEGDEAEEH